MLCRTRCPTLLFFSLFLILEGCVRHRWRTPCPGLACVPAWLLPPPVFLPCCAQLHRLSRRRGRQTLRPHVRWPGVPHRHMREGKSRSPQSLLLHWFLGMSRAPCRPRALNNAPLLTVCTVLCRTCTTVRLISPFRAMKNNLFIGAPRNDMRRSVDCRCPCTHSSSVVFRKHKGRDMVKDIATPI